MRVSSLVAISLCLLMSSVAAGEVLQGRKLYGFESKGDSLSEKGFTDEFCMDEKCHAEKPEFEGMNLVGLAVGFTVTAIFMIFGVMVIIRDEIHRIRNYRAQLVTDRSKLQAMGVTAQQLQDYDNEFTNRETAKKKTAEELERERQELMAKN